MDELKFCLASMMIYVFIDAEQFKIAHPTLLTRTSRPFTYPISLHPLTQTRTTRDRDRTMAAARDVLAVLMLVVMISFTLMWSEIFRNDSVFGGIGNAD